ncbi:MAG: polysaccharide deacetylase family protein [Spirochaetota bacterium]|nr:polysaccharide deacetylase family protein [Spirochaetota bacterium]
MRILLALSITFCSIAWYPIDITNPEVQRPKRKSPKPKAQVKKKLLALTFDACEQNYPSYFDNRILNIILENRLPTTLFISGRFLKRNYKMVETLSYYPFIEIENHSYSHDILTDKSPDFLIDDITRNNRLIEKATRKRPRYFRFPAGLYNQDTLALVTSLGLKTVHWSFESGDPNRDMTAEKLINRVLRRVRDGSILIFHINRRGWHTADALPAIIHHLKTRGYDFVLLKDMPKLPYIK